MAKKRNKNTMNHGNKWAANKREVRRGLVDIKKISAEYLTVCGTAVAMGGILRKVIESVPQDTSPSADFVNGVRMVTAKIKVIRVAVTALESARVKAKDTVIPVALVGDKYEDSILDVIAQLGEVNEIGGHVNDAFVIIADTVVALCEMVIGQGGEIPADVLEQVEKSKSISAEIHDKQESK